MHADFNRKGDEFTLTVPGRTDLIAEGRVRLEGFRGGLNGDWVLKRVEHRIDRSGFVTSVKGEAFTG